jgi:hypothetical protein
MKISLDYVMGGKECMYLHQVFPYCGMCPPGGGGTVGPLVVGGASCLYESYFKQNMDAGWNIYFGRHFAWLKYEACFIL